MTHCVISQRSDLTGLFYPPLQKTTGLPVDECKKKQEAATADVARKLADNPPKL